jgi:hypothetical protein
MINQGFENLIILTEKQMIHQYFDFSNIFILFIAQKGKDEAIC